MKKILIVTNLSKICEMHNYGLNFRTCVINIIYDMSFVDACTFGSDISYVIFAIIHCRVLIVYLSSYCSTWILSY